MYNFSSKSEKKLNECHQDIQIVCQHLIKYTDFTVITGYRSKEEQKLMVEAGKSKTMNSKHNYMLSLAIDIAPYPIDWNNRERFYYLAGYFMGIAKMLKAVGTIESEFRFGGDWDKDGEITDNSFDDLLHFEII